MHFSASDVSVASRAVLLKHPANFAHVFGDLLERVPEDERIALQGISDKHITRIKTSAKGGGLASRGAIPLEA